jgi:anti-sigma factor RsiW
MKAHVSRHELALYTTGDLALWRRAMVRLHVGRCDKCRRRIETHRADSARIREAAAWMPAGVEWNQLASEMTANIRVGLAAGECVAPRTRKTMVHSLRPAAVVAGFIALLAVGWWLNTPPEQAQALGRAVRTVWTGPADARQQMTDERGPMVEVSSSGVEVHENGSSLGVSQGAARPLAVSVSVQGSASARYVDADTGQMTITSVYVQ